MNGKRLEHISEFTYSGFMLDKSGADGAEFGFGGKLHVLSDCL